MNSDISIELLEYHPTVTFDSEFSSLVGPLVYCFERLNCSSTELFKNLKDDADEILNNTSECSRLIQDGQDFSSRTDSKGFFEINFVEGVSQRRPSSKIKPDVKWKIAIITEFKSSLLLFQNDIDYWRCIRSIVTWKSGNVNDSIVPCRLVDIIGLNEIEIPIHIHFITDKLIFESKRAWKSPVVIHSKDVISVLLSHSYPSPKDTYDIYNTWWSSTFSLMPEPHNNTTRLTCSSLMPSITSSSSSSNFPLNQHPDPLAKGDSRVAFGVASLYLTLPPFTLILLPPHPSQPQELLQRGDELVFCIPWQQVLSVDELTESTLFLSVFLLTDSTSQQVEIVTGPCPARKLIGVWKERKLLCELRHHLKLNLRDALSSSISDREGVAIQAKHPPVVYHRNAIAMMKQLESMLGIMYSEDTIVTSPEDTKARIAVYMSLVLHLCQSLQVGISFSMDIVHALTQSDELLSLPLMRADLLTAEELMGTITAIVQKAETCIREYVVCFWQVERSTAIQCIRELAQRYLNICRKHLHRHTTPANFSSLKQKPALLKYIIVNNKYFVCMVHRVLGSVRLYCSDDSRLLLYSREEMQALVAMYLQSLADCCMSLHETTLATLSTPAAGAETWSSDFPWRIGITDGKYRSDLPEELIRVVPEYLNNQLIRIEIDPSKSFYQTHFQVSNAAEQEALAETINQEIHGLMSRVLRALASDYLDHLCLMRIKDKSICLDSLNPYRVFALAVLNDCHRLSSVRRFPSLANTEASSEGLAIGLNQFQSISLDKDVGDVIEDTINHVIKSVSASVINEAEAAFDNIDAEWQAGRSPIPMIVDSIERQLGLIEPFLARHCYVKLLLRVCRSLVVLYIKLFHRLHIFYYNSTETSTPTDEVKNNSSKGILECIKHDINSILSSFSSVITKPHTDYLALLKDLLVKDLNSNAFRNAVNSLRAKYASDQNHTLLKLLTVVKFFRVDGNMVDLATILAEPFDSDDLFLLGLSGDTSTTMSQKDEEFHVKDYARCRPEYTGLGQRSVWCEKIEVDDHSSISARQGIKPNFRIVTKRTSFTVHPEDIDVLVQEPLDLFSRSGGSTPLQNPAIPSRPSRLHHNPAKESPFRVVVKDIRCRNFPKSNLRVYFHLCASVQKTTVKYSVTDGIWEGLQLEFHMDTFDIEKEDLLVLVCHKRLFGRKVVLGNILLQLSNLINCPSEVWYGISSGEHHGDKTSGEVNFRLNTI